MDSPFQPVPLAPRSVALNTLSIISGEERDGGVILAKDFFPHLASKFILEQAGGIITNAKGESEFNYTDEIFIAAANEKIHGQLLDFIQRVMKGKNIE